MNRALHDAKNAEKILKLTAETMLLLDRNGICLDIDTHSDLWFLKEELLLGKNIFDLLPEHTREKVMETFHTVLREQKVISKNFKLELEDETYYFKSIMTPYDDMVLCRYRDITQRSNVKSQLEQSNRSLKEIQKAAKIGQWNYTTGQNRFHFTGYTGILCTEQSQSLLMEDYVNIIVDDDKQIFKDWSDRNLKGDNPGSIDYRVYFAGKIYYIRLQAYLWNQLPNGQLYIEGYIQNISEIQHRRNDINNLTLAINNAKENIFAATEDGTLIFANKQFKESHQIPDNEELGNMKVYDIVGGVETRANWQERVTEAREKKCVNFIANYPIRKDKSFIASEGIMYNVINDSGEESFWSFSHDISDRIRYETQIKRFNQIMDAVLNNLPAGIVVKDINNDYLYIYRNKESYNRDLFVGNSIGKDDFDFHPQEVAQKKRNEDIEIATTGVPMHWILEGKDRNGNLLILDKQKMLVGGDDVISPIILSIEWNITELELMKRALQDSKEKAEMSDKLKSAFLANMSHEIRTPLNAIVGFSQLIADSDSPEERKSFYNIVNANNERLLGLINEILDLSKIESGVVEFTISSVSLNRLCKEVFDAHTFRTPQGVQLIYEPSDQKLIIETDQNRVFQVFSNLIGNACKFTKEGSISYGYQLKNNKVVFHVSDTGMGIEEKKISKVFTRFAKLNNFAQGTGLGLSICKTIIERLGGEISVQSEFGKGTTFTFTLPYNPPAQNEVGDCQSIIAGNEEQECTVSLSHTTLIKGTEEKPVILVAEDTDSNYDLLHAILSRQYKLVRANDGIDAVRLFEEVKPDLILMDIKMPNLDGLDATKIIREISPTVPIIAQSAYAYEHDLQAAKQAGCSDFISKPIAQAKLKELIKKWLSL